MKAFPQTNTLLKKALLKIDRWARYYNNKAGNDVKIQQIWYSEGDMEEPRDTLFLITECKYSDNLENAVTQIDLKIHQEFHLGLNFQTWPCGYQNSAKYGFLEKIFEYTV